MNSPRFLILGGSGYLGRHLRRLLGPDALATYHSTPFPGGVHFDAGRMRLQDAILGRRNAFQAAFILYGVTKIDECARDPEGTRRVNVESVRRTLDDLAAAGIKPIYASTDAVFDGERGNWTEQDPPNPIIHYGRQKAEVERDLAARPGPWVIARLSKLVGGEADPSCLLGEWLSSIENERLIRCATDLQFTPLHVEDAASCLVRLAEPSVHGIYHVCGPRSMSRFGLLQSLLGALGSEHKAPKIETCSIRDFPFREPRPRDGSMSGAKLRALGVHLRDMETVCAEVVRQRREALSHS